MVIIREVAATFKVPPKLKPFTQITGSLKDFKNWHTKIFVKNSVSRPELKYDDTLVGYIAIDLKSDILIPIARGDEHQSGQELLHYLKGKGLIPNKEYETVFPNHPLFTFYNGAEQFNKEIDEKVIIMEKCIAYGLAPTTKMAIYCYGVPQEDSKWEGTVAAFLKVKGRVILKQKDQKSTGINPDGEMIIKMLRDFALGVNYIRAHPQANIEVLFDKAIDYSDKIMKFFMKATSNEITNKLIELKKEAYDGTSMNGHTDEKEVERIFFGYNGIKNIIHDGIRTALSAFTTSETKAIELIFGDVKKAMKEFIALGQI